MTYEELAATFVELGLFKTTSAMPTAADDNQVLLLQRVWRHLVKVRCTPHASPFTTRVVLTTPLTTYYYCYSLQAADLNATLGSAVLLRFLRAALLPQVTLPLPLPLTLPLTLTSLTLTLTPPRRAAATGRDGSGRLPAARDRPLAPRGLRNPLAQHALVQVHP